MFFKRSEPSSLSILMLACLPLLLLCSCRRIEPRLLLSQKLDEIQYSFSNKDFLILTQIHSGSHPLIERMRTKLNIPTEFELINPDLPHSYPQLHKQLASDSPHLLADPAELAKAFKLIYKYGWWNEGGKFYGRDPSRLFGFKIFGDHVGDQSLTDLLTGFRLVTTAKLKVIHLFRDDYIPGSLSWFETRAGFDFRFLKTGPPSGFSLLDWSSENTSQQVIEYAIQRCLRHHFYSQDLNAAEQNGLIKLLSIRSEDLRNNLEFSLERIDRFLTDQQPPAARLQQLGGIHKSSALQLDLRIPNIQAIIPEMLRILPSIKLQSPLSQPNLLRICNLKVRTEILQLGRT